MNNIQSSISKVKEIEKDFNIPNYFDESYMLLKEEIIDDDIITEEDLEYFSEDVLVNNANFIQDGKNMLLAVILDEDKNIGVYIITEGESTIEKIIKKGYIEW